jgi:hypothetical protein
MVKMMDKKRLDHIFEKLPDRIRIPLQRARSAFEDKVTEIVLRTDAPVCIYERKRMFFITDNGFLTDSAYTENLLTASSKEM